jgi:hypothetical protein
MAIKGDDILAAFSGLSSDARSTIDAIYGVPQAEAMIASAKAQTDTAAIEAEQSKAFWTQATVIVGIIGAAVLGYAFFMRR